MAGEVEESFSMDFQADSVHSGSISFGRFENEPLSWERRSSFSHNRYLEEVEKCSKPGSVIEKKAYFEAHFKKKGFFGMIQSAGHDGSDRATSENDGSERIGNQEDFLSDDCHYVQFDQSSKEDCELDEGGLYVEMDLQGDFEPNDDHYVQYGEILVDSDYHGECGLNGYEREDTITECPMVSFSSLQMESATNNSNDLENDTDKSITLDEAHQSDNETSSNILLANDKAITEVKKDDCDTVNADESSINMSMTMNEPAWGVEQTVLHDPANPSLKETKLEPQLNSKVNNVQVRKSTSSRSSKDPANIPSRDSPRRRNMEKNLSKHATPATYSASKTTKEVSKNVEKLVRESKSENGSRVKKASESQPSVLKSASKGIQEERLNQAFNSTKSSVKPRAAAFNFKCSERAERRKEFYMKLEEKLHAKEAEMNQMQAMSQEKTEADIKKLRKSLNFKATPMPSFYRTTLPSQSLGNKSVSNNTKSKKVQNKPKCPGTGADAALPLKMKMGNDQSADVSLTATEQHSTSIEDCAETTTSEASFISPAPSTNHSCHANSVTSNHTSGKKEGTKVSSQKHRGSSDSCKGAKHHSSEGNRSGETTKHRNDVMRKGVRNVGLRSSSKSGNLAVRVAS
ncbi:hypothetical protein VNO77_04691 [Canavalia gladiata]|uniref:TPX2 C-terminal domain-containing protein n=1 Tax=Canavalia gladiata TaxID=3824 RepID=A0AAN9N2M4_CANGL